MQSDKDKIEIKSLKTASKIPGWLGPLLLIPVFLCGSFFIFTTQNGLVLALFLAVIMMSIAAFQMRRFEPEVRRRYILYLLPAASGFVLSVYPFRSGIPALLGIVTTLILFVWYGILRHPIEYRQALKQLQAGETLKALQLATSALRKHPAHWESYQLRSTINTILFRAIEAKNDAYAAIQLKPNNHLCYSALGQSLLALESYTEAQEAFSKALELAPNYVLHHYNLGFAYYRLGQFREAIPYLEFAVRNRLDFDEIQLLAIYYLGSSLSQVGETQKASQTFDTLKQFHSSYNKLVKRYQDAPDYPYVLLLRQDFDDINSYLT
jgi:tetratricopeptide (TPR) repeat protein